jgi:hypothetical protein
VIATVRRLRCGGSSLREIAERLAADGVPTRKGWPWSVGTVHDIISNRGAIRGRPIGRDIAPFKGLVGEPMRALRRHVMAGPELHEQLRVRHASGEITARELALASMFQLWAGAFDPPDVARGCSRDAVVQRCRRPARECREALRAVCGDQLIHQSAGFDQLTVNGISSATDLVDITDILDATSPLDAARADA